MNDEVKNIMDAAEAAEFNASVDEALSKVFDTNEALLKGGVSSTAVALANALSASDLVSAMCVEAGADVERALAMIDDLAIDMKSRARAVHPIYFQNKEAA